jgi:subtilisin family serine protease
VDRIDAEGQAASGGDVDVAIIDTGIDLDHPDLHVVGSTNCTGGVFTTSCVAGGDDDNGHGSHVAGIVAAKSDGAGVRGVAPGARLWAVKVLDKRGSGLTSWIIAGIDWVTARAATIKVANMSLGWEGTSSTSLNTAIHNSVAAGVTYAVAAGNSSKDAATFNPANHPDVIAVSAIADSDGRCGGDVPAPSCGCLTVLPVGYIIKMKLYPSR